MKFFLLRHKATGKLMPRNSGQRAGFTWWEPSVERTGLPRLFTSRAAAKNAKRYWEAGCLAPSYSAEGEFDGMKQSKRYGLNRRPDDLEILTANLTIESTP